MKKKAGPLGPSFFLGDSNLARGEVEIPRRSDDYSVNYMRRNTSFRTNVFLKRKSNFKRSLSEPLV